MLAQLGRSISRGANRQSGADIPDEFFRRIPRAWPASALPAKVCEARLQQFPALLGRSSPSQSPPYPKPAPTAIVQGPLVEHHCRHPDIRCDTWFCPGESPLGDPNDLVPLGAHLEPASQDSRIPSEAAGPVSVANDRHRMLAGGHIVVGREDPAGGGTYSEQAEGVT